MENDLNKLVDEIKLDFATKIEEAKKGNVSKADFENFVKEVNSKLTNDQITEVKGEITKLTEIVKLQSEAIAKSEVKPVENAVPSVKLSRIDAVKAAVKALVNSEDMKQALTNGLGGKFSVKATIDREGFVEYYEKGELKREAAKVVNVASGYTSGTFMITERTSRVNEEPVRMLHIRDIMTVLPAQNQTIVVPTIEGYDPLLYGTEMVSENGAATATSISWKDTPFSAKRISYKLELSKNVIMNEGLAWLESWILRRIPTGIQNQEDWQIMYGDGTGNNLSGIMKQAKSFASFMTKTYTAGAISSVATYDSGAKALITFAAAHELQNGDSLTIENASEATYNATHTNVKVMSSTKVVINLAYVAEADTSAWTGTKVSYWQDSVANPTEYDVLSAACSLLNGSEFQATGIGVHSNTYGKIGVLKATDDQYVGVTRDAFGNININGIPLIVNNFIAAGDFVVGDFKQAAELREFQPLSIIISEDTQDLEKNQVTIIANEQIALPIINGNWFVYGDFATAKTYIETPAS